ncbi:MAG: hypothetical protein KDD82_01395 [Planctomycetes bacterium]|nr:hypothetical protein [Planctomycetota bacterium]
MRRCRRPILGVLLATPLAGCAAGPPTMAERATMQHVSLGEVSLYFRPAELERPWVEGLARDVSEVRASVGGRLRRRPPEAELLLYEPAGVAGAGEPEVLQTLATLEGERVVFPYPVNVDNEGTHQQLLNTVAHELSEATVLRSVTVLDPYLRWVHDGIAEFTEHEVCIARNLDAARKALELGLHYVEERHADGIEWVSLLRWRQIADWIVRSRRFMLDDQNLSLSEVDVSLRRVEESLAKEDPESLRGRGLAELHGMLERAKELSAHPWHPSEGSPEADRYLFYVSSFAVWLHLERREPGTLLAFLDAVDAEAAADDYVLTAPEVAEMLSASELPYLDLDRIPLEWVERTLKGELLRLGVPAH